MRPLANRMLYTSNTFTTTGRYSNEYKFNRYRLLRLHYKAGILSKVEENELISLRDDIGWMFPLDEIF